MSYSIEEIDDPSRFRLLLKVPYTGLLAFVLDYLKRNSAVMIIFWASCIFFLMIAIYIRISLAGSYAFSVILTHTLLGLIVLPLLSVPVHEGLHVIPYFLFGARDIRAGMDLRQYLFYVTAHRYVLNARQFRIVAAFPYQVISISLLFLILYIPGPWKRSLSLFLFVHSTMCAGDFALLNFYFINRKKNIFTWDDADTKEAYFFEELK